MALPHTTTVFRIAAGLALLVAGGSGACRPVATPPPGPRSVVLVVLDGVGVRLGAYGAPVATPHLDGLARAGRRFDLAFRTHPDRDVSRAAFVLGRRPESFRAWDAEPPLGARPPDAVALPEAFAAAGYWTGRAGSLGESVDGLEAWQATHAAAPGSPPVLDEGGIDARVRTAIEWIGRAGRRPFFVVLAFEAPPAGWLPPASALAAYPLDRVRPEVRPRRKWLDLPTSAAPGANPGALQPLPEPPSNVSLRSQAARDAYVTHLDAQVGVLLDALEAGGHDATTAVVVLGDVTPDPRRPWLDDVLFDESLRVSLIVRAWEVASRPGRPAQAPVEVGDLHRTLIEIAGLPVPGGVQGRSLVPALADPWAQPHRAAIAVTPRAVDRLGRSVRTRGHRYTLWPDGSEELFDHAVDPLEQDNLALSAPPPPALGRLRRVLAAGPAGARLAVPSPPPPSTPGLSGRPSVLLLIADDLGARLGTYGFDVETPHLDSLAARGRRFDRAYVQYPSCNPSRTSFMTGLRPETTGVMSNLQPPQERLPATAVPLQEHFRAHGYFTARVGKVYHGPFEDAFSWDVAEHADYSGVERDEDDAPAAEGRGRHGGVVGFWQPTDGADADEPDGRTARRVAALLGRQGSRPFFIAAGFHKPHLRWRAPRVYFDRHPPERVRVPDERADDWRDIPQIAIERGEPRYARALLVGPLEPDDLRRRAIAAYHACVSFVDAQVGIVLDALDRHGLSSRTLVVVVGDHGFHLGEHSGLWRKNTLFEESVRVPLLVAGPGVARPGVAASGLVELLDLYPTLLELAGLPPVPGLEGVSLVPLLDDPDALVKTAAFSVSERAPPAVGVSLRTARYRYTLWPDGSEELYDHARDPDELRNLGSHAATDALRRRLRLRLDREPWGMVGVARDAGP